MLSAIARWLSSPRAAWPVVVAAVVIVPLVGLVDFHTDPVVQLNLFYVISVVAVAWAAGRRPAFAVALYVAVIEAVVTDLQSGVVTAALNALTDLVLYVAVAMLVVALRRLL